MRRASVLSTVNRSGMQKEVLAAILVLSATDFTFAMLTNSIAHLVPMNVKQFVNTSERIWTYKTTNRGFVRCEVVELERIYELSIVFKRSLYISGRRQDVRLRGVFDKLHKRRMTIMERDAFINVENMLYMPPDRSCAVFKIESLIDWDVVRYDLRVRNSSVHTAPCKSCRSYYYNVIKYEPSYKIYSPGCQRALKQGK
uniref:Lipocalin n=1 Tax=Rhipicephalus appendiculatus TaxID=34631 RepID=A0A131YUJ6_RHIAP